MDLLTTGTYGRTVQVFKQSGAAVDHGEGGQRGRRSKQDPRDVNALIDAEIDAWWRDLVATIDDDYDQEGWLGSLAAEESNTDHELEDELALCRGSSSGFAAAAGGAASDGGGAGAAAKDDDEARDAELEAVALAEGSSVGPSPLLDLAATRS
jgi:hypothetical protein